MKNTILFSIILTVLMISSCSKDGAMGPSGPAGSPGATGVTGVTGPSGMNVIVKNYSFTSTDFTQEGTYGQPQYKSFHKEYVYDLTQNVYDNGLVLAYYQGFGTQPRPWYSLPQTLYMTNYSYVLTFNYSVGWFGVQLYPSDLMSAGIPFDLNVKIVIIPASSGKKETNLDYSNYAAVKAFYNLKD